MERQTELKRFTYRGVLASGRTFAKTVLHRGDGLPDVHPLVVETFAKGGLDPALVRGPCRQGLDQAGHVSEASTANVLAYYRNAGIVSPPGGASARARSASAAAAAV